MSLAWKVTVTVCPLRRCRRRGRRPHRQPARHTPHRRLLGRQLGTGERHPADGRDLRLGQPSDLGVLPGPVSSRAVGPHDAVPGAPARAHQRDDLPVRLGQPTAQPAARPGHRHLRQRGDPQRQDVPGHQLQRRERSRPHVLDAHHRHQRAAVRQQQQRQPLRRRAVHHELAAQRDQVLLHQSGPGNYRWQCFVPCGLGFLYGNGGPMSTLGYMGGFMQVVA